MPSTLSPSHHDACRLTATPIPADVCLSIECGHDQKGDPYAMARFASGEVLTATPVDPDLGFDHANTVLHDAAHSIIACLLGLDRSPVLERVVELRSLSQEQVDLEEAAVFAIQAWCASLQDNEQVKNASVTNAINSLERIYVP